MPMLERGLQIGRQQTAVALQKANLRVQQIDQQGFGMHVQETGTLPFSDPPSQDPDLFTLDVFLNVAPGELGQLLHQLGVPLPLPNPFGASPPPDLERFLPGSGTGGSGESSDSGEEENSQTQKAPDSKTAAPASQPVVVPSPAVFVYSGGGGGGAPVSANSSEVVKKETGDRRKVEDPYADEPAVRPRPDLTREETPPDARREDTYPDAGEGGEEVSLAPPLAWGEGGSDPRAPVASSHQGDEPADQKAPLGELPPSGDQLALVSAPGQGMGTPFARSSLPEHATASADLSPAVWVRVTDAVQVSVADAVTLPPVQTVREELALAAPLARGEGGSDPRVLPVASSHQGDEPADQKAPLERGRAFVANSLTAEGDEPAGQKAPLGEPPLPRDQLARLVLAPGQGTVMPFARPSPLENATASVDLSPAVQVRVADAVWVAVPCAVTLPLGQTAAREELALAAPPHAWGEDGSDPRERPVACSHQEELADPPVDEPAADVVRSVACSHQEEPADQEAPLGELPLSSDQLDCMVPAPGQEAGMPSLPEHATVSADLSPEAQVPVADAVWMAVACAVILPLGQTAGRPEARRSAPEGPGGVRLPSLLGGGEGPKSPEDGPRELAR
jgi:hypothetical protein